jgi:AAA domain
MKVLPTCRADRLAIQPAEQRWLIEGLWTNQAVGIVGGEPKCCKSFLALDLAVAVASGADALRRFRTLQTGPVLLYAGEDPLHVVRGRLQGIAHAAAIAFEGLDVHAITAPTLRLDLRADQQRLVETVRAVEPKLLVLDPFVRLHRIDENAAAEVAPVLGFLRNLQRRFGTAVLLVHHARKAANHVRAGQALRGSSELHAWGDSNLYLRRKGERLVLAVEHRAAPSGQELTLELQARGRGLGLLPVEPLDEPATAQADSTPAQRIQQALAATSRALTQRQLRRACRMRTETVGQALADLVDQGRVLRVDDGYRLVAPV